MNYDGLSVLVTGGAGFIGSFLSEKLVQLGAKVTVFDNLSNGSLNNLKAIIDDENFEFILGDLLDKRSLKKAIKGKELIFHLAANPEVRLGYDNPEIDFNQNLLATRNLLEALRSEKCSKKLAFSSTSTVYGEAKVIPTPEDYGPLIPISLYGASKLGCEALIFAYSHLYGLESIIYRFANVVGSRSNHGVIVDFMEKLSINPKELLILGDGNQTKSYLAVEDCISAFFYGLENAKSSIEVFNVGSEDTINVKKIASIVIEEMGLKNVKLSFKSVKNGRGWMGDVKFMQLDVTKLKKLGWSPKYNSEQAIRLAVRAKLTDYGKSLKLKP
ncbi:MAG: NAD-dependent epimerase/dehydratase family protein [Candidatus Bathyarchaeia archaeon]